MFFVGLIVLLFVYVLNLLTIVLMILLPSVYHLNLQSSLNSCSIFVVLNSFSILIIHLMKVAMYYYFISSYHQHRMMLCRQPTSNCLVMIQPALISYSFDSPPQAVLLDATSVRPDVLLLLDTFFTLVVFHGATIAAWRDAGYVLQYTIHLLVIKINLNMLTLNNYQKCLQKMLKVLLMVMFLYFSYSIDRFPVPRYILCDEGKSQSRFLMAKVNPSGLLLF